MFGRVLNKLLILEVQFCWTVIPEKGSSNVLVGIKESFYCFCDQMLQNEHYIMLLPLPFLNLRVVFSKYYIFFVSFIVTRINRGVSILGHLRLEHLPFPNQEYFLEYVFKKINLYIWAFNLYTKPVPLFQIPRFAPDKSDKLLSQCTLPLQYFLSNIILLSLHSFDSTFLRKKGTGVLQQILPNF